LLLGDLSEADFTQRLMNFAQSLRANGGWDNEAEKDKTAYLANSIITNGKCAVLPKAAGVP